MAKPTFSLPVIMEARTTKRLLDDEMNRYGGLIYDGSIAAASDPTLAQQVADDVAASASAAQQSADDAALYDGPRFDTVTDFFASTDTFTAGTYVRTDAEGLAYKAVDSGGHVQNNATTPQEFEVLRGLNGFDARAYNIIGDGSDETAKIVKAVSALDDYDTLNLSGLEITIFSSVAGVTTGDAVALADVPRVFDKTGVTIRNGSIKAASPSVSGTKYRFPTTLTFDGCTDCRIENLTLHSKGESWGDTDASVSLGSEARRAFAAQNGGHAFLNVRSIGTKVTDCSFRLCGSVATYYSMSSHDAKLTNCFSNPGSLGYAAYVADAWAGDASVSGFPALVTNLNQCSASKEGYTYGSKGCVLSEDGDVSIIVNGGFYADAYPNGASRDLGYAFGASSSQTIVAGAVVDNCASIGYAGTTNGTDFTHLKIAGVYATNLRKTVHQDEDTSVGETFAEYTDVRATVTSGSTWASDGDLTREKTSFVALPNAGNIIHHKFGKCVFDGAEYGIITDNVVYGSLVFDECELETDGFLWNVIGLASGSAGRGRMRGLYMDHCAIRDVSSSTVAYTSYQSNLDHYVSVDISTSTVWLSGVRDIETSTIGTPATYVDRYQFPRPEAAVETLTASKTLQPDSARYQSLNRTDAAALVLLPRPDKYKFMDFVIVNTDGTQDLVIEDYTSTTTFITLTPGQAAKCWNDGVDDYVRLL